MSKVGSLRKLPVGEYSIRITSGVSTSKRASPSVTTAFDAAVPLAMSMLFERLTGEVSEVAVCALAPGPAATTTIMAATTAIAALPQASRRPDARRRRHDHVEAAYKGSSSHRIARLTQKRVTTSFYEKQP